MKKKVCAMAAVLTLSSMLTIPAFANTTDAGMEAGNYGAQSNPIVSPGVSPHANQGMNNWDTGTNRDEGRTGVGIRNYDNNDTMGTNTFRPFAAADRNMDWGWLGLVGLVGLAGLMNRNREHTK